MVRNGAGSTKFVLSDRWIVYTKSRTQLLHRKYLLYETGCSFLHIFNPINDEARQNYATAVRVLSFINILGDLTAPSPPKKSFLADMSKIADTYFTNTYFLGPKGKHKVKSKSGSKSGSKPGPWRGSKLNKSDISRPVGFNHTVREVVKRLTMLRFFCFSVCLIR